VVQADLNKMNISYNSTRKMENCRFLFTLTPIIRFLVSIVLNGCYSESSSQGSKYLAETFFLMLQILISQSTSWIPWKTTATKTLLLNWFSFSFPGIIDELFDISVIYFNEIWNFSFWLERIKRVKSCRDFCKNSNHDLHY